MTSDSPLWTEEAPPPLTAAEQQRVGALLATVTSQTLLHSLAMLNHDNMDATLIIAELLSRLPLEPRPAPF